MSLYDVSPKQHQTRHRHSDGSVHVGFSVCINKNFKMNMNYSWPLLEMSGVYFFWAKQSFRTAFMLHRSDTNRKAQMSQKQNRVLSNLVFFYTIYMGHSDRDQSCIDSFT